MAISNAVQRGSTVYIYDDRGRQVASISAGHQPGDGLRDYTAATVNVQRGSTIYTYNEKGSQIRQTPAR